MNNNLAQTNAASYRLAADDADFIRGDSMRGTHLMLEYAHAEERLRNWGVRSTVVIFGSAQVVREAPTVQETMEFRSEFLHAFLNTERVRSHLPVVVRRGGTEVRADGMEYDNLARVVELKGRQRAVFTPRARPTEP